MGIDLAAGMTKRWRVQRLKDGTVTLSKRGRSRFWKRRRGKR